MKVVDAYISSSDGTLQQRILKQSHRWEMNHFCLDFYDMQISFVIQHIDHFTSILTVMVNTKTQYHWHTYAGSMAWALKGKVVSDLLGSSYASNRTPCHWENCHWFFAISVHFQGIYTYNYGFDWAVLDIPWPGCTYTVSWLVRYSMMMFTSSFVVLYGCTTKWPRISCARKFAVITNSRVEINIRWISLLTKLLLTKFRI